MKHPLRIIAITLLCVVVTAPLAVLSWSRMYPEPYDPKNLGYILWKHGMNNHMDLEAALAGMTHDTWAVNIVKGMTKDELNSRFGYIRTLNEARPYLQFCPSIDGTIGELGTKPQGKEVVFLRDDAWMVILDNGKAVDLVLCKGY